MTHLWIRAEERENERRVAVTPEGVSTLLAAGFNVTVEDMPTRIIPTQSYVEAGAKIAQAGSWRTAPSDVIILGLKELPMNGEPLRHRHIMFGHAYKGQPEGQKLLQMFKSGGGTLYDLEYLTDETSRRVAAFGYWAGFAGAAMALQSWAAQRDGGTCASVTDYETARDMQADVLAELGGATPSVIVIGALGRVGTGATDMCAAMGAPVTKWDMAETANGGLFPEILDHDIFLNCILATPNTPVFVPASAKSDPRKLSVIGDIACDPDSDFSPIKVYDHVTSWAQPAVRVHGDPVLDVTAIDNLPSLLPLESSFDFAAQLLPSLLKLGQIDDGVWGKACAIYDIHRAK
ncbi:MAG: saccharopine dehydrogenase [Planktomarina sp.]